MATSTDIAVVGWAQTPMVRHTEQSEVQLLLEVITDALTPLGLTRADVDFTCLGSCDYITGQAFSFVIEPRRHRGLAAQAGLPRGDGRGLGPLRGLAPAPGGRHRDRRGHRLRPVLHRGPGAHLPDGDGPLLPRPHRRRPPHLRRSAGPGRDRRRHRRRAVDGRGGGALPGQGRHRPAPDGGLRPRAPAPPRHPADHRRGRGHGAGYRRPGPPARRPTGVHHRVRPPHRVPQPVVPGPRRLAVDPHWRPRPPAWPTARSRSPSCRPRSPTRSCCCGRSSDWATTWPSTRPAGR